MRGTNVGNTRRISATPQACSIVLWAVVAVQDTSAAYALELERRGEEAELTNAEDGHGSRSHIEIGVAKPIAIVHAMVGAGKRDALQLPPHSCGKVQRKGEHQSGVILIA